MVLFAHLADCHLGAWRDPRLRSLVDEAFRRAVDIVIKREVDFVLIAGDMLNTALPGIDQVRHAVSCLERLRKAGIPVYAIAGSHDYSPTGKTMLGVFEEAGLLVDVFKGSVVEDRLRLEFFTDPSTGIKLCGVLGKAGQLDRLLYERLDVAPLEAEQGEKVFLFHTGLTELKPKGKEIGSTHSVSFLPKGFSYYAGGHVHIVERQSLPGYNNVVYPGPLFPASFSELEELGSGGFYLVELDDGAASLERVDLPIKPVVSVRIDCAGLRPDDVAERLAEELDTDLEDAVVLVRLSGMLAAGSVSEIDFRSLFSDCMRQGAYACMKNTLGLSGPQLDDAVHIEGSAEEIERELIGQRLGVGHASWSEDEERALIEKLLSVLSRPRLDGETKRSYEERVVDEASGLFPSS